MLKKVDFANARTIVELGSGTGVITREILKRAHVDAEVIAFEIHAPFVRMLNELRHPRLKLVAKPAQQLTKHVPQADVVISSLPLMAFKEKDVTAIISQVKKALRPGGQFVQFQYGLKSYALLKKEFSKVGLGFTPLNIPPAFVYRCKK
jgi:phospholipid N-methyltransferase